MANEVNLYLTQALRPETTTELLWLHTTEEGRKEFDRRLQEALKELVIGSARVGIDNDQQSR